MAICNHDWAPDPALCWAGTCCSSFPLRTCTTEWKEAVKGPSGGQKTSDAGRLHSCLLVMLCPHGVVRNGRSLPHGDEVQQKPSQRGGARTGVGTESRRVAQERLVGEVAGERAAAGLRKGARRGAAGMASRAPERRAARLQAEPGAPVGRPGRAADSRPGAHKWAGAWRRALGTAAERWTHAPSVGSPPHCPAPGAPGAGTRRP